MPAPTHLATVWQNARALRERGDLAGAKIMLEYAVEAGGAAYGIDHPDVLATARMLAGLHRETGELTAARRTLEDALAAGQLSLAENHPLMLLLAYDLGLIADELGNKHEARRNLAPVARLGPAALGQEHPAVRAAASYLGGEESIPPAAPALPPPAPAAPTPPPPPPPARFVPAYPIPESLAPRVGEPSRPRRRRTLMIVAAVIAVATAGTTAAVVAVMRPASTGGPGVAATTAPATPVRASAALPAAGPGPTEVRLRDDGSSITITWRDPSPGTVPFIVAGGRAGEQARPFANLPAGKTSHTLHGLNPRLEYCFTVVAVYSTESFTVSELVCTRRTSRSPQPTRS